MHNGRQILGRNQDLGKRAHEYRESFRDSLHINIDPHVDTVVILHWIDHDPMFLQDGDRGLRGGGRTRPKPNDAAATNLVPRIHRRICDFFLNSFKVAL